MHLSRFPDVTSLYPSLRIVNSRRGRNIPGRNEINRASGRSASDAIRPEHDQDVIQMNEVRRRASGRVQRRTTRVACMIDEPGHPTGRLAIPGRGDTMLKTISAALLAISVIAAPAMAAGTVKTAPAPMPRPPPAAPVGKDRPGFRDQRVLNAKPGWAGIITAATVSPPSSHHHRFHKHVGANKPHQFSKVTVKHVNARHQARLISIRGRGFDSTLPPPRQRISEPGPYAIASPMAAGRCCYDGLNLRLADEFHFTGSML